METEAPKFAAMHWVQPMLWDGCNLLVLKTIITDIFINLYGTNVKGLAPMPHLGHLYTDVTCQ